MDDYKNNIDIWMRAIEELNIGENEYLREREMEKELPWDFVDIGVDKEFLVKELQKAKDIQLTTECREKCSNCGMRKRFPNCMIISKK